MGNYDYVSFLRSPTDIFINILGIIIYVSFGYSAKKSSITEININLKLHQLLLSLQKE